MSGFNDYFHKSDLHSGEINGYQIHHSWWSRKYEYPWAYQFVEHWQNVADMGCGWMDRPFKDMIAYSCKHVYAIDADERVLDLPKHGNMTLHQGSFTEQTFLKDESVDRVFCISVLEDVGDKMPEALQEFKRVINKDGLIILTFDVWYDKAEPLGQYPGIDLSLFWRSIYSVGLQPVGEVESDKKDVVFSQDFNLCCYHTVLEIA
jgi:SAM-dependent methyltransferase